MIPEGTLQTGDGEKDHTQNLTLCPRHTVIFQTRLMLLSRRV